MLIILSSLAITFFKTKQKNNCCKCIIHDTFILLYFSQEKSLPRHDNVGFSRRLAKADQLLTLTKNERVMCGSKRHKSKESLY